MIFSILSFITGLAGPVAALAGKIVDLKALKAKAETDVERQQIQAQIEEAHDRQAVLVAEAGSRLASGLNASMRFLIALPAAAILWKFLFWDKTMGSLYGCAGRYANSHLQDCTTFVTDPLDPNMWYTIMAVIGFYFISTKLDRK